MRRFIIRVDAGGRVGFGHAVRSLELAKLLRDSYGISTTFYSNPYEKLRAMYEQYGFGYVLSDGLSEVEFLHTIPSSSVVFIDRWFPYSGEDIRGLSNNYKVIMFHNECEGMYDCDYVIFPSAHLGDNTIGNSRRGKILYGPEYIIINKRVLGWQGMVGSHIAVTTGASDPNGLMIDILNWVNEDNIGIPIKALYGFDFQYTSELEAMLPSLRSNIEVKEFNYDDLLSSKLAVTAFGVTAYELIFANVPIITTGHNQKNTIGSEILQNRYGCNYHLREFSREELLFAVHSLWNDEEKTATMKRNQVGLIDGKGLDRLGHIISEIVAV